MGLKIIGAGFGRTGTKSLQIALTQLGFGPCHHMHSLKEDPSLIPDWVALSHGNPISWDTLFHGFRSQVDWPGSHYWKELSEHYPDSKVVLTVRDPDQWFESFSNTIAPFIANRGKHPDRNDNIRADMMYRMVFGPLFDGRFDKKEVAISVYTRHIEMVQKTVPENRLLTYDVSDGWDQLCEFLQVPRPANTFPMTNTTRDFNNKK